MSKHVYVCRVLSKIYNFLFGGSLSITVNDYHARYACRFTARLSIVYTYIAGYSQDNDGHEGEGGGVITKYI